MKKKILLRAPVLTQSGYGCHSRQLAQWLLNRPDVEVMFQALPWGQTPWFVDLDRNNGLIGEIMKRTGNPQNVKFDVTFQVQLPNEWDPTLGKYNVGITAGVETDKCNPEWVKCCNKMNRIIVPSEHVKKNLTSSGNVVVPLDVIPEAYAPACALPKDQLPVLPELSTNFNFLVFGQITGDNPYNDRKNTFFTLKWLFEEFKDEPNVGIVIKTNSGRNTRIDKNKVVAMMGQIIKEARKGPHPRLHVLHGDMHDNEVAALYKHPQIRALVSATRGEGYGLPILEAAVSGLPVIATDWSGHLDFMRKGKFISLFYNLQEVHKSRIDGNIFQQGMRWAEPSEGDFKKRTRKFYNSSSTPKEWAIDLSKKLIDEYSLERISEKYDDVLKEAQNT